MTTKKQKQISGVVRGVSTWYTCIGQLVERLPGVYTVRQRRHGRS